MASTFETLQRVKFFHGRQSCFHMMSAQVVASSDIHIAEDEDKDVFVRDQLLKEN